MANGLAEFLGTSTISTVIDLIIATFVELFCFFRDVYERQFYKLFNIKNISNVIILYKLFNIKNIGG
ncbi:hypothetical protein GSQ35_14390 [Clostridioides difficile]|nr:hypothetical protein [Clostridioides difficile]